MNREQLHKLIAQGEGQGLEFKESGAELDRIIQSLSAFANTNSDGGCVLIGIGDKGKIKEVLIGKETIKQIADKISAHTDADRLGYNLILTICGNLRAIFLDTNCTN